MNSPSVYVITPAFNDERHVARFLASVRYQTYKNLTMILIDDGSTDNTSETAKRVWPSIVILEGDGNLWWAGSTNKGVNYALAKKADYILTVNIDVELDKKCVENLVTDLEKLPKTLLGSMVCDINNKDKVWYFGGYWDRQKGDLKHTTGNLDQMGNEIRHPEWLTGMGLLIPAESFRQVGEYDGKNFPQYFADADFSLRCRMAGYKLSVSPKAIVYADLSSSWLENWLARPRLSFFWNLFTSRRSQYNVKKRFTFYRKYWGNGYIKALFRLYFIGLSDLYKLWAVLYIKRLVGRT